MKRIIALWLAALMLSAQPLQAAVCVGFGQSVGVTCSGDWSSGQYESFESATDAFCTTDWSESDANAKINLKDTGWHHCGTASMGMTCASGNTSYVEATVPADGTFTIRFYFRTGVIPAYANLDFLLFRDTTNIRKTLRIRDESTVIKLYTTTDTSQWFAISENTGYFCVITWNSGGTNTMQLYTEAGAAIESSSAGDYTLDFTSAYTIDSFRIYPSSSSATSTTFYIEDILYSSSSADLSGGQTCN